MRIALLIAFSLGFVVPLRAELTVEQRSHDFQNLAALYAKRYAPYEWKRQISGFDLFDLKPWMDRVRQSKDDLEFFEICAEYVASLDDLHTSFRTPSNFVADTGIFVDIYDGRVLIESINRARLPAAEYPFQVGDELVSLDGKTAEQWITELSRLRRRGNPSTTRRSAADLITFRPQSVVPRAVELSETATVVIRRESGEEQTYEVPWVKTGLPHVSVGPVPSPRLASANAGRAVEEQPLYLRLLEEARNWSAPSGDHLQTGTTWSEELGQEVPRRYLLGWGSRTPTFALPPNFQLRLGRAASDFHFSGTYDFNGTRIGYLRFPNFAPPSTPAAIQELDREIAFLQENTDGLVIDVMRNTGGGCYMLDAASRLIPYPFFFFGEEIRVTYDRLTSYEVALRQARARNADEWIIAYLETLFHELSDTYYQNRGRTGAVPACNTFGSPLPPGMEDNPPAATTYRKPMIVLIDEFSTSAGDIFPAMLQDNRRAPLVGARTNGAGGSVSGWPTGLYSESQSSNTNTLVVRNQQIVTAEYPTGPYVENIGARPDIPLEYMTRENLVNRGRPFVDAFSRILVDEIRRLQ
jgi:C-terminal processing protease CtpA/Prc